jgi:hypothetical protein
MRFLVLKNLLIASTNPACEARAGEICLGVLLEPVLKERHEELFDEQMIVEVLNIYILLNDQKADERTGEINEDEGKNEPFKSPSLFSIPPLPL